MAATVTIRGAHVVARFDARGAATLRVSEQRVFDDTLGNKHLKLDLEACVTLPDARFHELSAWLDADGLRTVDVFDGGGGRTRLELEGIERRADSSTELDVAVDVDGAAAPAQLGTLSWERH